jgi:HK97 family phage prohead protease
MPIPKPNSGESRDKFMSRCLSSDVMQQDYSDNAQRFAVCSSSFDDKDKKMFDEEEQEITTGYFEVEAELKAYHDEDEKEKDKGMFEGYASIFGNKDLGNDVIEKGAFMRSLRRKGAKKIKMLYQHDTKEPIGVFDKVMEDQNGLYVKGRLAMGTQKGKEVYELMKMGAIDGLSVGYRVDAKGHHYDDKRKYRVLKEVDLMEISAVTFPMNPRARIQAVKSDMTVREWEHKLREVGNLSHSESKVAASAVHKALSQREVDKDADLLGIINATTQILTK